MTFNSDYIAEFLSIVLEYLKKEQQDPLARAVLEMRDGELTVVLEARGRQLPIALAESVYHYLPDGTDPGYHATWLAELFNEDAAWIDPPNPSAVEQADGDAQGSYGDVTIEGPSDVFFSTDLEVQN